MSFLFKGQKRWRLVAIVFVMILVSAGISPRVLAGDTLPYTGDQATGANQPTQHGYTSHDILQWEPERDPYAEMLRARVPLQERVDAFADTQANPELNADTQMFNLAGDYGNAFMDSTAYTNKFGQYTFPYWQYIDYYSYWHGMATADVPQELYDPELPWYERWFEFGVLNIPNPAYTNAAHKNGVKSLGVIFFSSNDRGPQTYTQMLVEDEAGGYPVADKLIEIADYFGFDGYFFNQEEATGVRIEDLPRYKEFLQVLQEGGLYVQWYDSVNHSTGEMSFQNQFNELNSPFIRDDVFGDVTNSIFLNYNWNRTRMESSKAHAENLGLDPLETVFAGVEAGADRFGQHRNDLRNNLDEEGNPMNSIAMLGADFTHHGLDEDLGGEDTIRRFKNDYQWMSFIRDRAFWSGPQLDPTNSGRDATIDLSDVAAQGDHWDGVAAYIAERSVISGSNFISHFNLGRGLAYYDDGQVSSEKEWSNINIQDIPITWQWWMETNGTPLEIDFDFGPDYQNGSRYEYEQIGAYNGGSSLVVSGDLDEEQFLRLYKTDMLVKDTSTFTITYYKSSEADSSSMSVGLILKDAPQTLERIEVPYSGEVTNEWVTEELDLSEYENRELATFGVVFDPHEADLIENYQMNIGQVKISDGTIEKPESPNQVKIDKAFPQSNEMVLSWDLEDYELVRQYNVYNNGEYVGGIYDDVFYIKNLNASQGDIEVTAVSADGQESDPTSVAYDFSSAVSQIEATQDENGDMLIEWELPSNASGDIQIHLESEYNDTSKFEKERIVEGGESSIVLSDMPVNGDRYHLRIKIGNNEGVSYRDRFIDRTIEAYSMDKIDIDEYSVTWQLPTIRDWHYLFVYEDGEPLSFLTTYNQGERPYIIRGRTHLNELTFATQSLNSKLEFVIQDYSGNRASTIVRITEDGFHELLTDLNDEGELSQASYKQLSQTFQIAQQHKQDGRIRQAINHLERLKSHINGKTMEGTAETVKKQLMDSADSFIMQWHDQ
ncbi:endo-beta-N-acetylglucosaminidase [Halalkalibacter sp. APA_J-10(15)]|uniref:endo-beta-N-acetylglucosaminidase n=1 Tax=Halalkalibacter sp. APA_J-10(15) TaxID=2933805 RepID=UPI001FF41BC2|nr:endo-beta-N-acetylglucosaminidase [Halalkalibacter sp. APA_J-10(15)]MCK0470151.1 endo-beta-N-acetylglucosaminidase [Halalkalibacter sp. APA_J-10(15)]